MTRPNSALIVLAVAAALVGLYGRFAGIGLWPLGVDEFYISRSIDHILQGGLPKFPCGGYYSRGLMFQYSVAALRLAHLTPEFAGRVLAGVCSLLALPAAYLLGKRIQGVQTAWLVVVLLLLSIWEIEMARFGRMYAPFQAVFCWYLVCYLRYTIDEKSSALLGMVLLSIVGVLTWEGGTLLGVANIFAVLQMHQRGRPRDGDWRRLGFLIIVLALLFLASRDLRDFGAPPAAEVESVANTPMAAESHGTLAAVLTALRLHWPWCMGFLIPLGLACAAARFIGGFRGRWLTCAGLIAVLLAGLAHAFAAVGGLLVLMLLTELISWPELVGRHSRTYGGALLAALIFWSAYFHWVGGHSYRELIDQPDVFQRIARPWGRTMPLLTVALFLAVVYLIKRSFAAASRRSPEKNLLALLVLLVLAVGTIATNRIETRYTFFLYPLILALSIAALMRLNLKPWMAAAVTLFLFAATEDFQIQQIARIDSAQVNFRIGMSSARADHYYPRNDMRSVAQWFSAHVTPGDVVLSGIPNLDQYYPAITSFFLEEQDNRYDAYVCSDGRTERWGNHPVVEKIDSLEAMVNSPHRVYATVFPDIEERLVQEGRRRGWSVTPVYTALDGKTHIISIQAIMPTGLL